MSDFKNKIPDVFQEPKWCSICDQYEYGFDVIKNGSFFDKVKLNDKPYYIVGRQNDCDLVFEHPSLSRYHAILIYCGIDNEENVEKGWYLFDLSSTHGTFVNKNKIESRKYIRIRTGYIIKFAGSSRLYVLTGPEHDKEEESKYTWTELQEMKKAKQETKKPASVDDVMCSWGLSDMDDECKIDKTLLNDDERYKNEQKYRDDPKKVLKWWYEQEGLLEGPQFEYDKEGKGRSICRLELPVYNDIGDPCVAEVSGGESKKALITRCAYEACKLLDEMDELYRDGSNSKIIRKDNKYYQEKDYYSSDEDEFFDRTGQIEKKRKKRMEKFGIQIESKREDEEKSKDTYKESAQFVDNSIVKFKRLDEINDEILELEDKLEKARQEYEVDKSGTVTELDEIEQYMQAIQSGTLDSKNRMKLRSKIFELQKEENILRKQLKLQIPVTAAMRATFKECKKNNEEIKEREPVLEPKLDSNQKKKLFSVTLPAMKLPEREIRYPSKLPDDYSEEEEEDDDDDDDGKEDVKEPVSKFEPSEVCKSIPEESSKIIQKKKSHKKRPAMILEDDVESESKKIIINWIPPADQTGDGRTRLNDELGY